MDLKTESPRPAQPLESTELPELDNGPHFFYGLQWWFFGLLAVFGFFYLLYDEWRAQRSGETSTREEVLAERKQARVEKDRRKQAVRAAYERERQKDPRVARRNAQSARSMPPSTGQHRPGDERRGRREQEGRHPAELLRLAVATAAGSSAIARGARRLGVTGRLVQLGHPLGADPPGQQPVDPDAARSELVGQGLGHHRQPGTQAVGDRHLGQRRAHARGQHQGERAALARAPGRPRGTAARRRGTPTRRRAPTGRRRWRSPAPSAVRRR